MFREIAIIAPGAMGSAVAERLREHGTRVITLLEGRSEATKARAEAAGMIGVELAEIAGAALVLSIVPPGEALSLAHRLAPVFERTGKKPIFADCNAVDVGTVKRIGETIAASGARFADGAIIGSPPKPGETGPRFHFSGEPAQALAALAQLGLQTSVIEGPVGAASALKMSYAGINKGLTGLAAVMALAAGRAGAASALYDELEATQPHLLKRLTLSLPDMYPKAYRFVAEMREIAAFAGNDSPAGRLYQALADVFQEIADDYQGNRQAVAVIDAFVAGSQKTA